MTTTVNSEDGRPRSGVSDMKAVLARAHGGPDVLRLENVDRPGPEAGQVLVGVQHVVGKAVIVVEGL